nr:transcription repressor NadR [uncultured Peptostreptococcus sp.]
MTISDRRQEILGLLKTNKKPISASDMATKFGVTRQVIVADIAILRASNVDILSTNRGYILNSNNPTRPRRVFKVSHDMNRTEEELNIIVDAGGKILDVIVDHPIYGEIRADLNISNRRQVTVFMDKLVVDGGKPLSFLSEGKIHLHTVEASCEDDLDYIGRLLDQEGFLLK